MLVKHAQPLSPISLDAAIPTRWNVAGRCHHPFRLGHRKPPLLEELELARKVAPQVPLLIGSGATAENIGSLIRRADGVIVASSLKRSSRSAGMPAGYSDPFPMIDPIRVRQFVEALHLGIRERASNHACLAAPGSGSN